MRHLVVHRPLHYCVLALEVVEQHERLAVVEVRGGVVQDRVLEDEAHVRGKVVEGCDVAAVELLLDGAKVHRPLHDLAVICQPELLGVDGLVEDPRRRAVHQGLQHGRAPLLDVLLGEESVELAPQAAEVRLELLQRERLCERLRLQLAAVARARAGAGADGACGGATAAAQRGLPAGRDAQLQHLLPQLAHERVALRRLLALDLECRPQAARLLLSRRRAPRRLSGRVTQPPALRLGARERGAQARGLVGRRRQLRARHGEVAARLLGLFTRRHRGGLRRGRRGGGRSHRLPAPRRRARRRVGGRRRGSRRRRRL
mmetsp:Transcript_11339/g.39515  ORF Transcript_11339/g.39515 Transcript_11339/m.39515 type:complete len:316 (+) Transcript_11339:2375-3322(+)